MPGFYCDEAEDKTYSLPRCEICGNREAEDYIDTKYVCLSCANRNARNGAIEFKKKQLAYENRLVLKIARENEKRAKGE